MIEEVKLKAPRCQICGDCIWSEAGREDQKITCFECSEGRTPDKVDRRTKGAKEYDAEMEWLYPGWTAQVKMVEKLRRERALSGKADDCECAEDGRIIKF